MANDYLDYVDGNYLGPKRREDLLERAEQMHQAQMSLLERKEREERRLATITQLDRERITSVEALQKTLSMSHDEFYAMIDEQEELKKLFPNMKLSHRINSNWWNL